MKRAKAILLIGAGMVVGLLAVPIIGGLAVAQPVPDRAGHAGALPSNRQYRYRCEGPWDTRYWMSSPMQEINARGRQGWRWMGPMAGERSEMYCFERAE